MNTTSMNMRNFVLLILLAITQVLSAQNYTLPDEFLNAKNGVKIVKIYSENEKQPRTLVTQNQYDKQGRLIQANGDGTTNVVRYFYETLNRYSSIQISYPNGKFFRKTIYTYDSKKGTTRMSHYANSKDSTQITSSVLEDSMHRVLRHTQYMEGRENSYVEFTYGDQGQVIGQKDSSAQTLTVNIYQNDQLVIRKVYSAKSVLLNTYRFYYNNPYSVKAIVDSMSGGTTDAYLIQRQEEYGNVSTVLKNGNKLTEEELEEFINRFPMVEPRAMTAEKEGDADDYLKKDHTIEKDDKGNITKDTLVFSQGYYRQVLVFVYEYEYY